MPSPAFPESLATDQELESEGTMHQVASKILMTALWLARLARPDLALIVTRFQGHKVEQVRGPTVVEMHVLPLSHDKPHSSGHGFPN